MMWLVANGPGIGDALVLTAVARAFREQRPGSDLGVMSAHPELLWKNPDVDQATTFQAYAPRTFDFLDDMPRQTEHQVVAMCRALRLTPPAPAAVRCYLTPGPDETAWAAARAGGRGPVVTIHVQPGDWCPNRTWALDRWREVARRLREESGARVLQVGGAADPVLEGVDGHVLGAPLRHVGALMQQARLHLGSVSGPMHLASAVGTPAVIVYGGREDPARTGYPLNTNLTADPGCAVCWQVPSCGRGRYEDDRGRRWVAECMDQVTADQVVKAAKRRLGAA